MTFLRSTFDFDDLFCGRPLISMTFLRSTFDFNDLFAQPEFDFHEPGVVQL